MRVKKQKQISYTEVVESEHEVIVQLSKEVNVKVIVQCEHYEFVYYSGCTENDKKILSKLTPEQEEKLDSLLSEYNYEHNQ